MKKEKQKNNNGRTRDNGVLQRIKRVSQCTSRENEANKKVMHGTAMLAMSSGACKRTFYNFPFVRASVVQEPKAR